MECINVKLVSQLKDYAIWVTQNKCKDAVAQMFCVELKFVANCFLMWFNKKFKSQHLEIDLGKKKAFETKNPVNWNNDKCYI